MQLKVDKNIKLKHIYWTFNFNPKNFDNHISRSIPLFAEFNWIIMKYSSYFLKDTSLVYDLGCSSGRLLRELSLEHSKKKNIKFYGYDVIDKMINYANRKNKRKNIFFKKEDIIKLKLKKNDLVISLFTIQFINKEYRQKLIKKIYDSLNSGGAFFFAEKVRSYDARSQDMSNEIYIEWKKKQGFSDNEINNKSKSLKGVLDPFSSKGNKDLLKQAGFKDFTTIGKFINFEMYLAIK